MTTEPTHLDLLTAQLETRNPPARPYCATCAKLAGTLNRLAREHNRLAQAATHRPPTTPDRRILHQHLTDTTHEWLDALDTRTRHTIRHTDQETAR